MSNYYWSEEETDFLKKYYPEIGSEGCAKHLDRTSKAIRGKANFLGLRYPRKGPRRRTITKVLNDMYVLAICPKHGEVKHRVYRGKLLCDISSKERNKRAYPEQKRKYRRTEKARAWLRRRRATPLGKYEHRLRASLSRLNRTKGYSCKLPYSATELAEHLEAVREQQGNICPMCGASYDEVGYDIDHIIPTSSAKNEQRLLELFALSNLSLLCPHCNRHVKKDKLVDIGK